ncbi:MAG: hypothetical protein JSV94_03135 [Methanobacteriota archaeon]|nr:MAG: hypothetical protein JSV94_03135 [Euryarchaeota archaeon]
MALDAETPLELRLSRLTVQSLRNLCDTQGVGGYSGLLKDDLVEHLIAAVDEEVIEDFCAAQEDIYFVENMAKAIKWSASRKIVQLDSECDDSIVNATFTLRRSDGYEVYRIRFVNQTTDDIATSCECLECREKGYFCPHQMAVLVKSLANGIFSLEDWTGPMTAEAEDLISANVLRRRRG